MQDLRNRIRENWARVEDRIARACMSARRARAEVKLLAVTKSQPIAAIEALYELGQRDFGENYVSELKEKQATLQKTLPDIRWHFLGHIQTNKAAIIAQCAMVHSLDSLRHAQKLAQYRTASSPLPVFVEVNLGEEPQKNGVSSGQLPELLQAILPIRELHIVGLMTVLPLQSEQPKRFWFEKLAQLKNDLPELSMGMSDDFEDAIYCGATWIRLGRILLGKRT